MKTSLNGINLIKRYEGICDGDPRTVHLDPYLDPVGIWTIGYGHALRFPLAPARFLRGQADKAKARQIYPDGITLSQAVALLVDDLAPVEAYLNKTFPFISQVQFDALASFAFNCGIAALNSSTLAKKIWLHDVLGAAAQFALWNKSGGKVLPGLVNRRAAECALFLSTSPSPSPMEPPHGPA